MTTTTNEFGGSLAHIGCDECNACYNAAVTMATVTGSNESTVTYDHRDDSGTVVVDHQATATRLTDIEPCGSIEPHDAHRWWTDAVPLESMPEAHTCPGIANDARRVRAVQFHDIDTKVDRVRALVDRYRTDSAALGAHDWKFTGRGSDLARIQHDLAVVLGEE